jgi:hypothetical protein
MMKKIGDRPEFHHEKLNDLNKEKANTPTMGGLIILLSVFTSTVLWTKLGNPFVQKAIILMIWFGAIGAIDDWLKLTSKIRHRSRNGLKPWEKLVFQLGGAVLIATFLSGCVTLYFGHEQCRQFYRWYGWISQRMYRDNFRNSGDTLLCRIRINDKNIVNDMGELSAVAAYSAVRRIECIFLLYSRSDDGIFVVQLPPGSNIYG